MDKGMEAKEWGPGNHESELSLNPHSFAQKFGTSLPLQFPCPKFPCQKNRLRARSWPAQNPLLRCARVNDSGKSLRPADFDYLLPPELIAQQPAPARDASRLLVLHGREARWEHRHFPDLLQHITPGDALIFNDTRVIPARLWGNKAGSGGQIEMLLTEENNPNDWWALLRPGKRVRAGTEIHLTDTSGNATPHTAVVLEKNPDGQCRLQFSGSENIFTALEQLGETPLPPYIERVPHHASAGDRERYQTVFAQAPGSVAAPTAGLHFTPALLAQLRDAGAQIGFVTLHVGLGTFAPMKAATLGDHVMHEERYNLPATTAELITRTRASGRRVFAIGTTTARVLESVAAQHHGVLVPGRGRTRIFIHPPARFQIVDALLTNFHLPQSTLLMLVSAFAAPGELRGRDLLLAAYADAIRKRYRFFSYGDAMLLL